MAFTRDTFKIYNEYYQTSMIEELSQNLDLFNGGTNNSLILDVSGITGDYKYETFFVDDEAYDDRRSETDISTDYTFKDIVQREQVTVDIAGMNGYKKALSAWYKIAQTPEALSRVAGVLMARARTRTFLRDAFTALDASIEAIGSSVIYDGTGDTVATLTPDKINEGCGLFGDMSSKLGVIVMHSHAYRDMIGNMITEKIFNITDLTLRAEYIPALGRTVVVTDNQALYEPISAWVSGGTYAVGAKATYNNLVYANKTGTNTTTAPSSDATNWEVSYRKYYSYLLSPNAVKVSQGVMDSVFTDLQITKANSVGYIKAEYNSNIAVKGMSWKVSTGGSNPSVATLGTKTNWEQVATSIKNTGGVKIVTK